ncbi:MAG: phosphate ABC transporter substrate-binding protein PstS [Candidatus Acidiferrales bacterium]
MCRRQNRFRTSLLAVVFSVALPLILIFFGATAALAQTAETLSQVEKVFVESFGTDDAANKLHEAMIKQLRKHTKLEVVTAPNGADAIIKGSASIWVSGYVSADARSSANSRQPVLRGFLSVEVIGKAGQPLWSYLATPSKFRVESITSDLAEETVARLVTALGQQEKLQVSPLATPSSQTTINAAGATFPVPLYQKWFESFQERYPQTPVTYNAVGSEAGLRLLEQHKVDFAASDVPLSEQQVSESKAGLLQFATVAGAVVPIYNLKGIVRTINFTAEALADIYLGKIKSWNDPRIQQSNKNTRLPDANITFVHRSDGSGTTVLWTHYLSTMSPEWKSAVGEGMTVNWPAGAVAEGNEAVAALVQKTPNSIGYVELVYALRHQLNFGAVRNAAGAFVLADLASVTVAAKSAAGSLSPERGLPITNALGKGAYPISTFTWWVFPRDFGGAEKKLAILQLLQWMLTAGQNQCSALGYVPLPREIANRELQSLAKLK